MKKTRSKVFLYLENNLSEEQDLTTAFLKYMLSFLKIDKQKTVALLFSINPSWVDHEDVLDQLVDYSDVQLQYL